MMALKGIKVLELAGLAPVPFCGMVLAEFGASVIRVNKVGAEIDLDCLCNGKKSISINLKNEKGTEILRRLSENSDVLIEPFRAGVMEKLGLGPEILLKQNKRLIYARLTGYGQKGVFSKRAGHDINYAAMSGMLSMFGWSKPNKPTPPINILADFGGGGLMCALGIITALFEREKSGCGQIVDCSMTAGAAYLSSWIYRSQYMPIWGNERGENVLDGGSSFYNTYETKDGKFMAVGAIEPQFYSQLLEGLGISEEEVPQHTDAKKSRSIFQSIFRQKTQEEWCKIFDDKDACVTPVLTPREALKHKHNAENDTFTLNPSGYPVPKPAPALSRTPAETSVFKELPKIGQHTEEILTNLGYTKSQIDTYEDLGVIMRNKL